MSMSSTNASVRSLRDKFQQQQQVNQYGNRTNARQDQKHDVLFQCIHCGTHQTISLVAQWPLTKDVIESPPSRSLSSRNNDTTHSSRAVEEERRLSTLLRHASTISEDDNDDDEPSSPVERSNYALDFRRSSSDLNTMKTAFEGNIGGLVDGCVRSSIHQISQINADPAGQEIVEVEVEYDPILGNVKSTRKRSSTVISSLDRDYRSSTHRPQSVHSRYAALPPSSERDTTPIWARRRISNSTVKPSDLVREHDKRDKLDANALRRLSRTDLVDEAVVSNATSTSAISSRNPSTIKDTILRWCQDLTQFYKGVSIRNFSSSWSDGLAFCALVHRYFPDEFSFDTLSSNGARQNFDLAFSVAYHRAGIEPLIDTDDMIFMGSRPDAKVVFTYVQSLYRHLSRRQLPAMMRERW